MIEIIIVKPLGPSFAPTMPELYSSFFVIFPEFFPVTMPQLCFTWLCPNYVRIIAPIVRKQITELPVKYILIGNEKSKAYFSILRFLPVFVKKIGVVATRATNGLGSKSQQTSWLTEWTFCINWILLKFVCLSVNHVSCVCLLTDNPAS